MTSPADERSDLPVDSDTEVGESQAGAARPVHFRLANLGLVALGGAVGTAVRFVIVDAFPTISGLPVPVLAINLLGAFALGLLLDTLARLGPDQGTRQRLRLLLGTGVLGGFTTYSTLSVDTVTLLHGGHVVEATLYALGTLVFGAVATIAGIALGSTIQRRRQAS
ncbi:fluoride efflux transporter CrcB [Subtercola sp. YIM 133946]|uniref:fluoride efflux transporter CrcB n=1 Tax=Subtercola sp. YIM 133946 TaxID=3118909 RepID=UPI002F947F8E